MKETCGLFFFCKINAKKLLTKIFAKKYLNEKHFINNFAENIFAKALKNTSKVEKYLQNSTVLALQNSYYMIK